MVEARSGRAGKHDDLAVQAVSEPIPFRLQIELSLEMEPESFGRAEVPGEAQGGIRANPSFSLHDLIDPPGRHADVPGQPILADLQRPEEIFLQDLTGMDWGQLVVRHGDSSSVVIDDLDIL